MKKSAILLVIVFIWLTGICQKPGDSLAILYYRVYGYTNPDELGSRYSKRPFSYYDDHKLVFLEFSEQYPGYYKVLTPKGDTIFVASNKLSTDQTLSHAQIKADINNGKRKKNYGEKFRITNTNIPHWIVWIILAIIIFILYKFWKRYPQFDRWYCNKFANGTKSSADTSFIKYSVFAGIAAGSVQLFSSSEFNWYMQEGGQAWGSFPSFWNWIMWGSTLAGYIIAIIMIIKSFKRFNLKNAIIYSFITSIIIALYFYIGLISGGLVVILIVIYWVYKYGNRSGGSGGSSSSSKTSSSGTIKTVNGQRYIKTDRGTWDNF